MYVLNGHVGGQKETSEGARGFMCGLGIIKLGLYLNLNKTCNNQVRIKGT